MGALTIRTSGQTLKLSGATNSAGTTVGVWSDAAHTQAVTLPATFSADTTFHFTHGSINITVTTPDGAVIYNGEVYPGFPAGTEISPVPTRAQMAAHEAADSTTYALRAPDWVTGRAYIVGELVTSSGSLYRCTTAHTSAGSFDGAKFTAISGGGGGAALYFTPESFGAVGYSTVSAAVSSATDNTAALNACIAAAVAVGGTVLLDSKYYPAAGPLAVAGSCTIVGKGVTEFGIGSTLPVTSPFLGGSVLLITGAATDGMQLTGTGASVNLRDFGILFAPSIMFSNTGHGINGQCTAISGSGHNLGPYNCQWSQIRVYGTDGNHYGYVMVNSLGMVTSNLRSYGGGVMKISTDSAIIVAGNMLHLQPSGVVCVTGTAHGYEISAAVATGSAGAINLMAFHRPQVAFTDMSGNAALGNPVKPSISQYMWKSDTGAGGLPSNVTIYDPDLEADDAVAHPVTIGYGNGISVVGAPGIFTGGTVGVAQTVVPGVQYPSSNANALFTAGYQSGPSVAPTGSGNTGFGKGVLAALTTASFCTAIGSGALGSVTVGANNTGLGQNALHAVTTSAGNTGVGASALASVVASGSGNTALGSLALTGLTGGSNCVAVGQLAGQSSTSANRLTAVGQNASQAVTSGGDNTHLGYNAGITATSANATTTAGGQTVVGSNAGQSSATQVNYITCVGYKTTAGANGAVAIGTDHNGLGATTSTQDVIALGTTNHQVQLSNNTTGAGSAALGANCPAVTATAPYTWFKMMSSDGSTVYVPAWK